MFWGPELHRIRFTAAADLQGWSRLCRHGSLLRLKPASRPERSSAQRLVTSSRLRGGRSTDNTALRADEYSGSLVP